MTSNGELRPIAYLRDLDGTGSLHPCGPDDPGARPVYSAHTIETQAKQIEELVGALEMALAWAPYIYDRDGYLNRKIDIKRQVELVKEAITKHKETGS